MYKSLDEQITYQRSGNDLIVNGTLTIKDWQEGRFGIRLKGLPDNPQEPTGGGCGRDYKYIHHYEQAGVDEQGQPIFAPVFADGPNNTGDGRLVPPIDDEPNGISALGGNDSVTTGAGTDNNGVNKGSGILFKMNQSAAPM